MMSKKTQLIFKVVKSLTLAVPLSLYLLLSSILFQTQADYALETEIKEEELYSFIGTTIEDRFYVHPVMWEEYGEYTLTGTKSNDGYEMTDKQVFRINNKLYGANFDEETNQWTIQDVSRLQIKKEQGWKIPIAFFMTLFGVGIVGLVILNKMQLVKKYPRVSVLVALGLGTAILYVINLIVSNIFNVFLIATISWAIYLIEHLVEQGKLTEKETDKAEDSLKDLLRKALQDE